MTIKRKDMVAAGRARFAALRAELEATQWGSMVVIDVDSGDYAVDASPAAARERLLARRPGAELYERRIGWPGAYHLVSVQQGDGVAD